MNILLGTQYPYAHEPIWGGVQAVSHNLKKGFTEYSPEDTVKVVTGSPYATRLYEETENIIYIKKPWMKLGSIYLSSYPRRIKKMLQIYQYQVLNAHTIDFAYYGLQKNQQVIFTPHGFNWIEQHYVKSYQQPIWNHFYVKRLYKVLQRISFLISINPYGRTLFEQKTTATIFDINNPVSSDYFTLPDTSTGHQFLWMGVISRMKNLFSLIKALMIVKKKIPDFTCVIAGKIEDPVYFKEIMQYINNHDLRDNIQYKGILGPHEKRQELSEMSFLVINSLNEHAPMVISESLSAGKPVIASNLGGIPFMIQDEKQGLLINPTNSSDIAEHILYLLTHQKDTQTMGRNGKRYATTHYHPKVIIPQYKKAYEEVLSS